MTDRIDFEAKSDRELLILTAQRTNEICDRLDTLNGSVARHEKKLITHGERLGLVWKLFGIVGAAIVAFITERVLRG